jgi:hypothetical protein
MDPEHPDKAQKNDGVQATGDKASCGTVRGNLEAVCPQGSEGKLCKNQAKSVYNSCYKGAKAEKGSGPGGAMTGPGSLGAKSDPSVCMDTFRQRQQLCSARKPPMAVGQPTPPDTCMQDAMEAQRKCLANSH